MSRDALSAICVQAGNTIRQTMSAIDIGGAEIALLTDDSGRLLGTVSDGDVRRALLRGASLDEVVDPWAHRHFLSVTANTDRAAVLDLMRARSVSQIPILDSAGKVVGLHLLKEIVGGANAGACAVVMAGGKGTRLGPITSRIPKPMVRVAGRPILERIILHLVGSGIRQIYLSVNHLREEIEGYFGDGSEYGCAITYLRERPDHPLGTAGSLRLLPSDVRTGRKDLVVMNGDLVTQFNVQSLLKKHREDRCSLSLGTRIYTHEVPFGVIARAPEQQLVGTLTEKPAITLEVNAGIYILAPSVLSEIPDRGPFQMPQLIERCMARGDRVGAYLLDGDWLDVGTPELLREARGEGVANVGN